MEENYENKANEVKQETVKTINEAKQNIKEMNFEEEFKITKDLLKNLWKKPVETIKEIANDENSKAFKTVLFLIVIWIFIATIQYIINHETYGTFNVFSVLQEILAPVLKILAMTVAFCIVNDRVKDTLPKVVTSVTIAYMPVILSSILSFLTLVSIRVINILSPISSLLRIISMILMYHSVKALAQEENESKAVKTFIKVEAIYYLIAFLLTYLGINIY